MTGKLNNAQNVRVVDFLLVLIERIFSLGVTAEALRAKIDRKSAISLQRGQFDPTFQVEGDVSHRSFCTDSWANECLITLLLTVFTQSNFVADFLQAKCYVTPKTAVLILITPPPPLGLGLTGNAR